MERLDKLLAATGRWSRREVKTLVREGRVLANGQIARSAEEKYDAETVRLAVDGEEILSRRYTDVMLHKPAGVVTATEDPRMETVLDLLPQEYRRRGLFPVGRLDRDTEGLLLLTNDGALAHELLSPKKHVDKVYFVRVAGRLEETDAEAFAAGITLEDGTVCRSAGLEIRSAGEESEALITLREGKFHQIKRMCASRGKPVLYLKRLSMGPLILDAALPAGQWRELTEEESASLRK